MNTATLSTWQGTDDKVDEIATAAGHPPHEPLLNADHGDLLLFLFLIAGAVGGFIVGYFFRALFPPRGREVGRNG
jgi:cobalt/nickel transport system permease protein